MNNLYLEKYLSEDDFSYYWNLVSNEKLMLMNYGRVFTIDEARYLHHHMLLRSQASADFGDFKVFESKTNTFIGLGSVVINDDFTEAEIEYVLLPEYWGMGYGSEIAQKLLHMFEKVGSVQRIKAITNPSNIASKRILLKNGFLSQMVYEIDDGSMAELFIKLVK